MGNVRKLSLWLALAAVVWLLPAVTLSSSQAHAIVPPPVLECDLDPNPLPAWAPNTSYLIGTRVLFNDRRWEALQSHTSQAGFEPGVAPSLWAGPIPCGALQWLPDTRYVTGSLVTFDGRLWRALQGHTSRNARDWEPASAPALWRNVPLDQSFVQGANAVAVINEGFRLVGQTYTAGATGKLRGVSINVVSSSTFRLRVTLHSVANGLPGGPAIGQARLAFGGASLDQVIALFNDIPQVPGQQYAIVVDYPAAPPPANGNGQGNWQGRTGNAYPAGQTIFSNDGQTWTTESDIDLQFRTFVQSD